MKNRLMMVALGLLGLASPMMAQGTSGGLADLGLPAAYLAMGIAAGLCGIGQGKAVASCAEAMARNPGTTAAIRFALILGLVFIESLSIYTLAITYLVKR
jgi:F-type H+-transporting ATPase subunit c